jgi:hypothetical protein
MKSLVENKNSYYRLLVFIAAIGLMIASCSDMNELGDRFLDKGSTVYSAKVDLAEAHSGFKRVEIEMTVTTQRINAVTITWNNGENQAEVMVNSQPGVYKISLEDMEENDYVFELVSTDINQNKSLPVEVVGKVYGDNYKQARTDRRIINLDVEGSNGIVNLDAATQDIVYTEVRYITTSDETSIVRSLPEETKLICPDAKRNVPFEYHSLFLPLDGIDSVETDWIVFNKTFPRDMVLCDKTGWSIAAFSDDVSAYPVRMLIDNNYNVSNNFWSSNYNEPPVPCPHWAIIDMQNPVEVGRLDTWRRSIADTNTVEFYIGDNPDPDATWEKIASGRSWDGNHKMILDVTVPAIGQYLKVVCPDSNRSPYTSITEVDVYKFE